MSEGNGHQHVEMFTEKSDPHDWETWSLQLNRGSLVSRQTLHHFAKELVYCSPPVAFRRQFWGFCIDHVDPELTFVPPIVDLIEAAIGADEVVGQHDLQLITLDVARTRNLSEEQQVVLARILKAHCSLHARRSRSSNVSADSSRGVHYQQGMHMLAACPLWAGLAEVEALALFELVLNTLCRGCHTDPDLATFRKNASILETLIRERLPTLAAAFGVSGKPLMLLSFDPLLCLFTLHLRCSAAIRFWDVLIVEGNLVVIFALQLALLEHFVSNPNLLGPEAAFEDQFGSTFAEKLGYLMGELDEVDVEGIVRRCRELMMQTGAHGLRQRVEQLQTKNPGVTGQSAPFSFMGAVSGLSNMLAAAGKAFVSTVGDDGHLGRTVSEGDALGARNI
eukprot:CAMPEP_0194499422 /NCGR_PEP_ID=MMETSP0253-20130528/15733_1 /TAXON_ID=2966 /ORGANISM="Noctiluca scintillans" /LENGTH=392 /DNA_ID=CAMNT_0039341171 /DNA_START=93 /DNA_END=1271 /DNA_ORIENTATION=+